MAYSYNDGSPMDFRIKKIIPVLIQWAKYSWEEKHTYDDLRIAIDAKTPRLGRELGYVEDILKNLSTDIPTLNALVCNSKGVPSDGFDYVDSGYSSLSLKGKKIFARGQNALAHKYDYSWVLNELGLELPTMLSSAFIKSARKKANKNFSGGEGKEHKRLKEYICANPDSIDIDNVLSASMEAPLLSGDKLDIRIETTSSLWAVEVKSIISDENDILRGIFQCVKYRAVLEAEKSVEPHKKVVAVLLVIEGEMPQRLAQIAGVLGVKYIDKFKVQ